MSIAGYFQLGANNASPGLMTEVATIQCGDVTISLPLFAGGSFATHKAEYMDRVQNAIDAALSTIGLSYGGDVGLLYGVDLLNADAIGVIYAALNENAYKGELYDLFLDANGNIVVYRVDTGGGYSSTPISSMTTGRPKAYVVTGRVPLPYLKLGETIDLLEDSEVYSYGAFRYGECANRIYNYYGSISYKNPHFEVTTPSDLPHVLNLAPYETLIGVIYTLRHPDDMEVAVEQTTKLPIEATLEEGGGGVGIVIDVDPKLFFTPGGGCIEVDPSTGHNLLTSTDPILGVDTALIYCSKIVSTSPPKSSTSESSAPVCDSGGGSGSGWINNVMSTTGIYSLSIGSDFIYTVKGQKHGYSLIGGIPVFTASVYDFEHHEKKWVTLPSSISSILLPATLHLLVNVSRPSLNLVKKTEYSIGPIVEDEYEATVNAAASQVSFCATPIIRVAKPASIAYNINGKTVVVDQSKCYQDSDPRTRQDFSKTPCAQMERDLSGADVVRIQSNAEDVNDVAQAATHYGEMAYTHSIVKGETFSVPGSTVTEYDLGKSYGPGVINSITWSFQQGSGLRATITTGSPVGGPSGISYNKTTLKKDSPITREAVVVSSESNGVIFKVYIDGLGYYTAASVITQEIYVGSMVTVSLYNNIAEEI